MKKRTAKMHRWRWDDLRFLLAVAEQKTLAGAARTIGVNHTTVLRRLNAFERNFGLRLFDRSLSGYALTEAGEELLRSAHEMSELVSNLERKLTGKDLRLEGILRVTTCDTLMGSVLPGILKRFHDVHPGITIEVTTGSFVSDLAQRDAHVSIRTGDAIPETLIGRRIADVAFAIYANEAVATQCRGTNPIQYSRWLVPDATLAGMATSSWLRKNIPDKSIVFRADSLIALRRATQAGLGLAVLPRYLANTTSHLQEVRCEDMDLIKSGLWVLTHEDLRRTARVNTFMSLAAKELQRLTRLFS